MSPFLILVNLGFSFKADTWGHTYPCPSATWKQQRSTFPVIAGCSNVATKDSRHRKRSRRLFRWSMPMSVLWKHLVMKPLRYVAVCSINTPKIYYKNDPSPSCNFPKYHLSWEGAAEAPSVFFSTDGPTYGSTAGCHPDTLPMRGICAGTWGNTVPGCDWWRDNIPAKCRNGWAMRDAGCQS